MKMQIKSRPKLLIIVLFQNLLDEKPYYAKNPAPPLPGILLAALTPPEVEVEVLHEMVRPIDYNTDADFIAISFMDYLSPHAYEVASKFRAMGKVVIGGGKFASTLPDEVEPYFDSICVGEAHKVWAQMVNDLLTGKLKNKYDAGLAPDLDNIPAPRYDLVESNYFTPIVTEASRGCPHPCTYCQLNIKRAPYRTRPIQDVIRDLTNTKGLSWFKRKTAMILDNNLGGSLINAKNLLKEIAKLKFWAIGAQYSIECLRDDEYVELLAKANCRMSFLGMESLNEESLRDVEKKQNKVEEYKEFFYKLNKKGILTFAGFMFALDEDTPEYYETLPQKLEEVGVNVILPSISIPIYGTPLHKKMLDENRIGDKDISHYEGDHVLFRHKHLTEEQIYYYYEKVIKIFYSWRKILKRWWRFVSLQSFDGSVKEYLLKTVLGSIIYFKLSIFQRHHAQERVFDKRIVTKLDINTNHQTELKIKAA
ncbi:MAG: B12-binding domain-containing radical SAM protein [Ignavibacteriaceae bacterium]|nr:B12-binding domain-containing radical SAM protein [Ignavibacteriaceae bacterium]